LLARASSQAPTDLTDHDSQATPGCKKRSIRRARNLFDRAHARFRLKNYRGNRRKMDVWRVFPAGRPVRSHVDDDIDAYTSCPVQAGRAGRHVLVGDWPSKLAIAAARRQPQPLPADRPGKRDVRTHGRVIGRPLTYVSLPASQFAFVFPAACCMLASFVGETSTSQPSLCFSAPWLAAAY
jgi:hypothetical protein